MYDLLTLHTICDIHKRSTKACFGRFCVQFHFIKPVTSIKGVQRPGILWEILCFSPTSMHMLGLMYVPVVTPGFNFALSYIVFHVLYSLLPSTHISGRTMSNFGFPFDFQA